MQSLNSRLKLLIAQFTDLLNQATGELKKIGPSSDRFNHISKQFQAGLDKLTIIDHQLDSETDDRKGMVDALEASHRELKDFIYMTSHDFREPLRKIASFGAILKESLDGKIDQEDQENLDFMIDGAERMNQMIEDLLAYSRINTRTLAIEKVDVNEVIEQLKQLDLGKPLEETNTHIEIPEPLPYIQADPVLARQLMRNLIIHAIKHRQGDGPQRIVIRFERTNNNNVKIDCEMSGIHPEVNTPKDLFKMSLHSGSRQEYEEAGTGLAICKKIVERHDGRIGTQPNADAGLILWFTLPVTKPSEPEPNRQCIDPMPVNIS